MMNIAGSGGAPASVRVKLMTAKLVNSERSEMYVLDAKDNNPKHNTNAQNTRERKFILCTKNEEEKIKIEA